MRGARPSERRIAAPLSVGSSDRGAAFDAPVRAGDYFDDGLTVLERSQIGAGKEAYLTGGAKLRYKRLTGQI